MKKRMRSRWDSNPGSQREIDFESIALDRSATTAVQRPCHGHDQGSTAGGEERRLEVAGKINRRKG